MLSLIYREVLKRSMVIKNFLVENWPIYMFVVVFIVGLLASLLFYH